jgi:CubicO group peptidase (beta-lactamase class C family)
MDEPHATDRGLGAGSAQAGRFASTFLLLPLIVVFSSSCRNFTSRQVLDPSASVARLQAGGSIGEEVNRLAKPLIDSKRDYGLIVGIIKPDGSEEIFRYGRTGFPGDSQPPDTNAIFQLGSVSKVFLASILAVLVHDGTLRYEDRVGDILPASVPLADGVADLTLKELITHMAGFPREPVERIQLRYLVTYLFTGENLYGYFDQKFLYDYLSRCELKPRAEREYEYSNIGTGLLAHLIELKTGRKLEDLIEARICRPLSMTDTVYELSPEQKKRLMVGHSGDQPWFVMRGRPIPAWDMGEIMSAPSGLYSSAHDLMIFARANLGMLNDPLVPILASTHAVQVQTDRDWAGYDWVVDDLPDGHTRVTFKHGMVAGYSAYLGMELDTRYGVVWLSNTFNWQDRIGHNLLFRLSTGLPPSKIIVAQPQ